MTLLALHLRYPGEARTHLHDGGGVLTAIGGNMPDEIACVLHRICGYGPQLTAFDVKLHVAADLLPLGYCARGEANVRIRQ